jgi:hypothetical protein
MIKRIFIALVLLSLLSVTGCEEIASLTGGTSPPSSSTNLKILKAVELGRDWEMRQMSFKVGANDEVAILMKLSEADKVDGYYYLEKGTDIDFLITGKKLVYRSPVQVSKDSEGPASDRFSFTASEAQGDTYTLSFHNPADEDDQPSTITVFVEVIYPVSASLYVPVEGE